MFRYHRGVTRCENSKIQNALYFFQNERCLITAEQGLVKLMYRCIHAFVNITCKNFHTLTNTVNYTHQHKVYPETRQLQDVSSLFPWEQQDSSDWF